MTQSIDPAVWGPITWAVLLETCKQGVDALDLFESIGYLLPCETCRRSYRSFCKLVPPRSKITADNDESAAQFVWCIKDMVNQKLSKPCIPYSTLRQRLAAWTHACSAWDVFDMLIIFALSVEADEQASMLAAIVPTLRRTLRGLSSFSDVLTGVPDDMVSPATIWRHFVDCKRAFLDVQSFPSTTTEALKTQYNAIARAPPTVPKLPRRTSRARSARR